MKHKINTALSNRPNYANIFQIIGTPPIQYFNITNMLSMYNHRISLRINNTITVLEQYILTFCGSHISD